MFTFCLSTEEWPWCCSFTNTANSKQGIPVQWGDYQLMGCRPHPLCHIWLILYLASLQLTLISKVSFTRDMGGSREGRPSKGHTHTCSRIHKCPQKGAGGDLHYTQSHNVAEGTSSMLILWLRYPATLHTVNQQSDGKSDDPLSSDMGRWQSVLELVQSGWRDHVSRLSVWGSEISIWVTLWLKVTDAVLWPSAT